MATYYQYPSDLSVLDRKRIIALADLSRGALANYFRGVARQRTIREVERALRQLGLDHLVIRQPSDPDLRRSEVS